MSDNYSEIIHSSLIRPQLLLGCDRTGMLALIFVVCVVVGPLGVFNGNFWFIPLGIILWFCGYWTLIRMSKVDPYMRQVFTRAISQRPWYPAVAYASTSEGYSEKNHLATVSCAGFLPYGAMISPNIILLKDGALLTCFEFSGDDMTTATDIERAEVCRGTAVALATLQEGFSLHFETIRVPAHAYPKGKFSEIVTYCIDRERKIRHNTSGAHFETRQLCFLKWQPKSKFDKTAQAASSFFKMFRKKPDNAEQSAEIVSDEEIYRFNGAVDDFINSFGSKFKVDVLSNEELLNAIALCVTGKQISRPMPETTWALDTLLGCDIENGDPFMVGDDFVKIVALDGFPAESIPCMLMWLGQLPFEYRWSSRFIPMGFHAAYSKMTKEQRKWEAKTKPLASQLFGFETRNFDKDSVAQVDDVNDAIFHLQRGGVSYGEFTSVIIVRDKSHIQAEENAREVVRVLQECLFTARVEKRNSLEAFMGSLPGNTIDNIRRPIIKSTNLSHFLMLSSAWCGLKYNPCSFYAENSPCLMQTTSVGGYPFRLNLHVGDVGHTLVLGPTGSGKSTLLATIVAQFDRYRNSIGGSQIFIFDKGRSMFPLISAMKNSVFYELGADQDEVSEQENPTLCPLASLETASDIAWASNYIETLVKLNGGIVNPARRKEINKAIAEMSQGTRSSAQRSLTHFQINVQDDELKNTLHPFTSAGPYGKYLDGTETNIKYSKFTCFEIERLMNLGEKVVTPVLLYLFHEIEKRLDGRPSLIILDEAWVALKNDLFRAQIAEWLRVLRKANCAVIMATQSLSQVLASDISRDILESCKTRIMLANPEANSEAMKNLYIEQMQLTETETNAIATSIPKREYFYVSPYGKRKFSLNLGALQLSFVGAAGKEDLKLVEAYKNKYGERWPVEYLNKERKLSEWSEYMGSLFDKYYGKEEKK